VTTAGQPLIRVGLGYDLHRLVAGRPLMIGGVRVDSPVGAVAHSDGDVVLHALTDAMLGAAGLPDIGDLFPDTEERFHNADSGQFVAEALRLLAERKLRPAQADVVILVERPRLGATKQSVRRRIAELLGLELDRVGVKAKTQEGFGPVGQGQAIACYAVVGLAEAVD